LRIWCRGRGMCTWTFCFVIFVKKNNVKRQRPDSNHF